MPTTREIHDTWAALAGHPCTCPPGCTDVRWGDGPPDPDTGTACPKECVPCRRMRGQTYHPPPGSKRKK